MQQFNGLSDFHLDATWLTIGSFDGVHIGHQQLITDLVRESHAAGASAVVLTFYPHPAVILRGVQSPFYLTSPEEKANLLSSLGVDAVITLGFNSEIAGLTANEFMERLTQVMALRRLWVGPGFALGKARSGNIERLSELGNLLGFEVDVREPIASQGRVVSSSLIRSLLQSGDLPATAQLLGRPYRISGEVIHGDGRGAKLGFPTANIQLPDMRMIPSSGVYACQVECDGKLYHGVSNIGLRPTFITDQPSPSLETYLLDYSGDLYGKHILVTFHQRLRAEQKFSSKQALIDQIQLDIAHTREVLK